MAGERAARVLLTADTVGGVWTYAVELARELDARGVQVALATMGAPVSAAQRTQVADLRGVTVHDGGFKLEWMQDCWDDVRAASTPSAPCPSPRRRSSSRTPACSPGGARCMARLRRRSGIVTAPWCRQA